MTADTSTFTTWEQDLMTVQTDLAIDLFLTRKEFNTDFFKI